MSGLNHYAYASANPIKYTDPTGMDDENGGDWDNSEANAIAANNPTDPGVGSWNADDYMLGTPPAPSYDINWDAVLGPDKDEKDYNDMIAATSKAQLAEKVAGIGKAGSFTVTHNFSKNVGGIKIGEKRITDDLKDGVYKAERYKDGKIGTNWNDWFNKHEFIIIIDKGKVTTVSIGPKQDSSIFAKFINTTGIITRNLSSDKDSLLVGNPLNGKINETLHTISTTMALNFANVIAGSSDRNSPNYNPLTPNYSGDKFHCWDFADNFENKAIEFYSSPITIPLF